MQEGSVGMIFVGYFKCWNKPKFSWM